MNTSTRDVPLDLGNRKRQILLSSSCAAASFLDTRRGVDMERLHKLELSVVSTPVEGVTVNRFTGLDTIRRSIR